MPKFSLSLVLPCFNEEAQIEQTLRNAISWFAHEKIIGEIVVVNNASTDGSRTIIENMKSIEPQITIVERIHHGGYAESVCSGCDAASMDVIATMDSDGQFDVRDFAMFMHHLNDVSFVSGYRVHRADSMARILQAKIWNIISKTLLHLHVKDIDCGMKAFRRNIWPKIRPSYATGNLLSAEMYFRLRINNLTWTQVPVHHLPRARGEAKGAGLCVGLRAIKELFQLLLHRRTFSHST